MLLPTTVKGALTALKRVTYPEQLFGLDGDLLQEVYRAWAKVCHEDRAKEADKPVAHEAFLLLTRLHDEAKTKVARGSYGDNKPLVTAVLHTKTVSYSLLGLLRSDDISDLYEGVSSSTGGPRVLVRLVRSPANNDLLKGEADLLAALPAALPKPEHAGYFPNLLDSFEVGVGKTRRRANVFAWVEGLVSLEDITKAYPNGLDPRDAAWMWNRLLEALHLLHQHGWVHGCVTPDRFLISPSQHTGCLFDFAYAVRDGTNLKALSPEWRALGWYAPEVLLKKPVTPSSDLFMAAKTMDLLLGGAGVSVSPTITALLKACTLGRAHRVSDAQTLHSDFKAILRRLYGKATFRPFPWPPRGAAAV